MVIMPKASRGIYWGRFNPPHHGHLQVMQHLLEKECDELIVAIGSCLSSHSPRNPFTGGERLEMLRAMIREARLESRTILIEVPDDDTYQGSAKNLCLNSPSFDVVFTNRRVIASIFSDWGFEVKSFPFFDREKYSSTDVRAALLSGQRVDSLVPPSVQQWLKEHEGIQRLKDVVADHYEGSE